MGGISKEVRLNSRGQLSLVRWLGKNPPQRWAAHVDGLGTITLVPLCTPERHVSPHRGCLLR